MAGHNASASRVATRLLLQGRVQGIGLRPAVARFAGQMKLAGYVRNTSHGVEIQVEGNAEDLQRFVHRLRSELPTAARVESLQQMTVCPIGCDEFAVGRVARPEQSHQESVLTDTTQRNTPADRRPAARVPLDVKVCDRCMGEARNRDDRRHRYPLTTCADCGPRYSIVHRMPFERDSTCMHQFRMCDRCRDEYTSVWNRRFHAQTIACPDCGPRIWLEQMDGTTVAGSEASLSAAAAAILRGQIVALRGVGGYQLLVDATSPAAVERLRERKRRRGKPLAILVASLEMAGTLARLDPAERSLLNSSSGPIVIAPVRASARVAPSALSGLNTIGLMLPTTPLHGLLMDAVQRPLVCTSANVNGEPLVFTRDAANNALRGIADVILHHDRPICRPIDDSVVRLIAGRPVMIRMARGYAPASIELQSSVSILALGGHQKVSIGLCNGLQSVLGAHIGDLDTTASRRRFLEQVDDLLALYGATDPVCVCDRHPEYFSTVWAEQRFNRLFSVYHHHAHIVTGMVEHGWLDRTVLGVSFDGTGYGTDDTVWGGEFLQATSTAFRRVGCLRPFPLPGGERAAREPWRVATAMVNEAIGAEVASRLVFPTADASKLLSILDRKRFSPVATSAGRLFDAVAALVLGIERCEFEGQAAMLLESACDLSDAGEYEIPIVGPAGSERLVQLDWRPLMRQLLQEKHAGIAPGVMAMRFHRGLANAIFRFCQMHRHLPVVLGGGVFQNRVLVELLAELFSTVPQPLGLPGLLPPNDGGLAAGQLAVVSSLLEARQNNGRKITSFET